MAALAPFLFFAFGGKWLVGGACIGVDGLLNGELLRLEIGDWAGMIEAAVADGDIEAVVARRTGTGMPVDGGLLSWIDAVGGEAKTLNDCYCVADGGDGMLLAGVLVADL